MDADRAGKLLERDLTERVIGCFFDVHNELGSGFLESVYANALAIALSEHGFSFERECILPVRFRGHFIGEFKADLVVDRRLVVELKAVGQVARIHEVQLVNYLKASGIQTGLLLNFGPRPEFRRRVHSTPASDPRSSAFIRVGKTHV